MASSSDGKPNNAPKKGKKIKLESIGQGGTSTSPQPTTGISDDERQVNLVRAVSYLEEINIDLLTKKILIEECFICLQLIYENMMQFKTKLFELLKQPSYISTALTEFTLSETEVFVKSIVTLKLVLEEDGLSSEKKSLLDMLQKFLSSFKEVFKLFLDKKPVKDVVSSLRSTLDTLIRTCDSLIRDTTGKRNEFKNLFEKYKENSGKRSHKYSQKNYWECIQEISEKLRAFDSELQIIFQHFESRNIKAHKAGMKDLWNRLNDVQECVIQCHFLNIWGIYGKDLDKKSRLAEFLNICTQLEKYQKQDFSKVLQLVNDILPPSSSQQASRVKQSLEKKKDVSANVESLLRLLKKEVIPNLVVLLERGNEPHFSMAYLNFLETISNACSEHSQHWWNGTDITVTYRILVDLNNNFQSKLMNDYAQCLTHIFKCQLELHFEIHSQINVNNDFFTCCHICKQHLMSLSEIVDKSLPKLGNDLKEYSNQMESFQEAIFGIFLQLLEFYNLSKNHTFYQDLSKLKKCLVEVVSGIPVPHLTELTSAMIQNIDDTKIAADLSAKNVSPDKILVCQKNDSFNATHFSINFEVIVCRKTWNLAEDEHIKLQMLFILPPNSPPSCIPVDFQPVKHGRGFQVMSGSLSVSKTLHGQLLYYKYMLVSSQFPPMEMLCTSQPTVQNAKDSYRLYKIPSVHSQSAYTVYDTCIHPQVPANRSWYGDVMSLLALQNPSNKLELPKRTKELEYCVNAHLSDVYRQLENCQLSSDDDIAVAYNTLVRVYNCLVKVQITNVQSKQTVLLYQESFETILYDHLSSILDNLTNSQNPLKVVSGLVLSKLFTDIWKSNITSNVIDNIFSLLQVHDVYSVISSNLSSPQVFTDSILPCLQCSFKETSFSWIVMMRVLPIYLQFTNQHELVPTVLTKESYLYIMEWIQQKLKIFKQLTKWEELDKLLTELEPEELNKYIALQLLLLSICKEIDLYENLLRHNSVSAIIMSVHEKLKLNIDQVTKISSLFLKLWNEKKTINISKEQMGSLLDVLLILNSKFDLPVVHKSGIEAVENCLRLLFFIVCDDDINKQTQNFKFIFELVKKWALKANGSHVFAGANHRQSVSQHAEIEHKFWTKLFSIGNHIDFWKNVVQECIKTRLEKVNNFNGLIKIFETLIPLGQEDDIVITVATNVLKEKVTAATSEDLEKLAKGSSSCKAVFSALIDKKFPTIPCDLNDIFAWDMWPVVLEATLGTSSSKGISQHSLSVCNAVKLMFDKIEANVSSGDISVTQLILLKQKWNSHVMQILQSLSMDHHNIGSCLQILNKRLSMFRIYMLLLKNFVIFCQEKMKVQLIPISKFTDLERNYFKRNVNELCTLNLGNNLCFPVFGEAEAISDMLVQFSVMNSKQFLNDIYYFKCQQCFKAINENSSIDDVYNHFLKPVFDHCCSVIDSLKSEELSLSDMCKVFRNIRSTDSEKIISHLYKAVSKCQQTMCSDMSALHDVCKNRVSTVEDIVNIIPVPNENNSWIKEISKKIEKWSSVEDYTHEADQIVEILSVYGLDNTANAFHVFSGQGIKNLLQQRLSSVDQENEKILLFLKKCKSQNLEVNHSIKVLGECKELREFVKNKSEDVNEMERFVQIALDTVAGEGAEVQDRLIDLSEMCSKFSAFLYQLTEDSISVVMQAFQQTWESLSSIDSLQLVESCVGNLKWYQFTGQLQGAGEQGTVKQLKDLNQYGEYTVLAEEKSLTCSVSLNIVAPKEEQISKKKWTLGELHELESKLVLITRRTAAWVGDKQNFQDMLLRICQISDIVKKLKEYGHMDYMKYDENFACSNFLGDLSGLDTIVEKLESTLNTWINYIWSCRYEYPHLNFYTTNQLILLRKEFTAIQNDKNYKLSLEVFRLLYSTIGEPVDSTVLVKKSLADDDDDDDDQVDETAIEENASSNVVADKEADQNVETKLSQAIDSLTNEQRKTYDELMKSNYDDYLLIEAITVQNLTNVYTAMVWCDELPEDDIADLQKKWLGSEKDSGISSAPAQCDTAETLPQSPALQQSFLHSGDIHMSHVASYFSLPGKKNRFESSLSFDDGEYISVKRLGKSLQKMAKRRASSAPTVDCAFNDPFEKGSPNMIVTPSDNVYTCILQIYSVTDDALLPTFEEILLCSENTTLEHVTIFWMRALFNKQGGRIYCLVHAEKLPYIIAENAIDLLKYLSQGTDDYRLVIMCSNEDEGKSQIVSRLHSYRREWNLPSDDDMKHLQKYVLKNITETKRKYQELNAAVVDQNSSRIHVITSSQSGVGKSLHIRKMKDQLVKKLKVDGAFTGNQSVKALVTVPLHGPVVTTDELLSMLLDENSELKSCIIHLDIPQRVLKTIDDILFSLLILGGLCNSTGQVWRCHPTQLYAIEITIPDHEAYIWEYAETRRAINLLKLMPNTECFTPKQLINSMDDNSITIELRTPMYQRVYQYLKLFQARDFVSLDNFVFIGTLDKGYTDKACLSTIIKHTNIDDPTWKEIRHFVWFLNIQLSACEYSNLIRRVKDLKQFTIGFMIIMSRDFATSSISTVSKANILQQHVPRQRWEDSMHPYLFFNKNRTSITHVGLKLERSGSKYCLVDSYTKKRINDTISAELFQFLTSNTKIPTTDISTFTDKELILRLMDFMNIKHEGSQVESPDKSYVLTHDNLTKIMAIQTRFRCQIPVVLMGETGCGKTHLIRYMCKFAAFGHNVQNMFILKVHGGTTEDEVVKCLDDAKKAAMENRRHKIDTVVFFDEANTSDVISLIKEVMCDGRCKGKLVPPFLKFVAACNPYRRHSDEMIKKLKGAGLGWRDEDSSSSEKLGEIPLRDLVYRVLELPDSMKALVYDFGQLKYGTEKEYIEQMSHSRLKDCNIANDYKTAIAKVLAKCQDNMKQRKDECSFVSLRDVERALVIFVYFYETFTINFTVKEYDNIEKVTKSLLLALGVSYLARMASRDYFMKFIIECIKQSPPLSLVVTSKMYENLLHKYQDKLLDCMEIENNIARNIALRENIFMMFICIELRIPLFLVGKPGSSKSLAKSIIENSMKGKNSRNAIMKNFKQIHLHSHQCSHLSTPASITEAFVNAMNFQEKRDISSFVSVVVLDEVGLAEASPYLPLKALHPLLEDGTEGSGSADQRVSREKRVAFIGISNWALDPAKMNRGIMVTRSEPTIDDLKESAIGICSNKGGDKDPVLARLKYLFSELASAYLNICKEQKREFFGLRDFYSLIKMLYWMSAKSGSVLTRPQLVHAVRRNFSGFDEFDPITKFTLEELKPLDKSHTPGLSTVLKTFRNKDTVVLQCTVTQKYISINEDEKIDFEVNLIKNAQFIIYIEEKRKVMFQSIYNNNIWLGITNDDYGLVLVPTCKQVEFIVKDTADKHSITLHSFYKNSEIVSINGSTEFIVTAPVDSDTNPDCTPLGLISQSLSNREITYHGESRYLLFLTDNYSSVQVLKHYIVTNCLQAFNDSVEGQSITQPEPFVLFGSSFPKDSEFAQVCHNISEIRLCMETGRMVILLNLENLYESLYDVLNQYYIKSGGHRYVDLGLRTNRMKCTVHKQFKLILIAEKDKVYNEFPTPLINRLEKHFVNAATVLKDWQSNVCMELEKWLELFVKNKFTLNDSFIGYSSDTKAAVVLQASYLYGMSKPAVDEGSNEWKEKVLEISKRLLLQIASPDAVFREISSDEVYRNAYFLEQEHSSLAELIKRIDKSSWNKIMLQVTTHNSTLTLDEVQQLADYIEVDIQDITRLHLEAFQTEQDFLNSIDSSLEKGRNGCHCTIFECDSGHENGNLISCCRYRLVDKLKESDGTFFILLIHLPKKCPKSDFVSFQEHPWLCYHVDSLLPSNTSISLAEIACTSFLSMSDLFYCEKPISSSTLLYAESQDNSYMQQYALLPRSETSSSEHINMCKRMYSHVTEAVSHLTEYEFGSERLRKLLELIPEQPSFPLPDEESFYTLTVKLVKEVLLEKEKGISQQDNWILDEAENMDTLQEAGTFQNALARKFDKLVIPILSKILTFVDYCCNLDILFSNASDEISKLWLDMYGSQYVKHMIIAQLTGDDTTLSSLTKRKFKCKFPFSWVITNLKQTSQDTDSLLNTLSTSEFYKYLERLSGDTIKTLAEYYVFDSVYLMGTKSQPESVDYYEMISKCVLKMVCSSVTSIVDVSSFFDVIVAVDNIYCENKCYFDLISELIFQMPTVVPEVSSKDNLLEIKTLLVTTLEVVLNSQYFEMNVPINNGPVAVRGWMQKLYDLHEVISNIVQEQELLISSNMLLKWQWICVMKMFFEYVAFYNEDKLMPYARRIEMYSGKPGEFQTSNTLRTVAIFLNAIENTRKNLPQNQQAPVAKQCWSFFLDVLSSLCVDGKIFNEGLVENLIDSVFYDKAQKPKDDKLKALIDRYSSEIYFLQSFVIMLVLRYEFSTSQCAVKSILDKVEKCFKKPDMQSQDCCNLIIANYMAQLTQTDHDLLYIIDNYLVMGHDTLESIANEPVSPDMLLAVARLQVSAQILATKMKEVTEADSIDSDTQYFCNQIEKIFTSPTLNDSQSSNWPLLYIMRYIVRKFGISTLLKFSDDENYSWIIPNELITEGAYLDCIAVYNPEYHNLRDAVGRAATGEFEELKQITASLRIINTVPLVLALHERIESSHMMPDVPSKALSVENIDKLHTFTKNCNFFQKDTEMLNTILELLKNKQCDGFPLMQAKKGDSLEVTTYRMIIIHCVLTVLANRKTKHIKFIATLLSSPETLKNTLLPAMPLQFPEPVLEEEKFLECVQGHQYTYDMIESHCLECGNVISSVKPETPKATNTEPLPIANYVALKAGDQNPPVAYLPSISYAIIRCIIHSCLLWSACHGKNVKSLLRENVSADIPTYFWNEIQKDIVQLSKSIGYSIDEACLLVHLVLKEINQKGPNVQTGISFADIKELTQRAQWEQQFHQCYIEPVVKDTELSLRQMLGKLTRQDYNDIFSSVYIAPLNKENFLWHVYPEPTVEHFTHKHLNLQLARSNPVLYTYLYEKCSLQATQYIPNILKWQKMTKEIVSSQFDIQTKLVVEAWTFEKFVDEIKIDSNQKAEYTSLFKDVQKGWELCRHQLVNYNRLKALKPEYINQSINESTKMKCLIPMTIGPGVITTAMVDHLTTTHNKFIKLCRKFVEESLNKKWLWKAHKVHLMNVDTTHFMNLEVEIIKLLTSHSIYTFTSSGTVKIHYNLEWIERDLVQKFVMRKPIITHLLEGPQIIWQRPALNIKIIALVKNNILQHPLQSQAKSDILAENKTVSELTSLCEIVETVMRFLQNRKERPRKKIKEFIEKDLHMIGKLRSEKIGDYCCLEHVVSLWRFLNVERAKIKVLNYEDPFSTLRKDFTDELDSGKELALEKALSKMSNLDHMLEVMYEFIQTYVQSCQVEDKNQPLRNLLNDFIHQTKLEPIISLMDFFPEDITLSHVAHTWKKIVKFRDEIKKPTH